MNHENVYLVFLFGTLILTLFSFTIVILLIHHKRKQHLHFTEKNNLELQFQTQLLQTRIEVQEQTFQYFSEEMHDNIGQILTLCKLHLHRLKEYNHENTDAEKLTENSICLITDAMTALRGISHTLNGNFVGRLGLKEALQKELSYLELSRKIKTHLSINRDNLSLSPERELLIFRIIQEGVNNAIKHGKPSSINITLKQLNDMLTVQIDDDGCGFDTTTLGSVSGIGFSNMQSRAAVLNGHIDIHSIPGKGTSLQLQIKL